MKCVIFMSECCVCDTGNWGKIKGSSDRICKYINYLCLFLVLDMYLVWVSYGNLEKLGIVFCKCFWSIINFNLSYDVFGCVVIFEMLVIYWYINVIWIWGFFSERDRGGGSIYVYVIFVFNCFYVSV